MKRFSLILGLTAALCATAVASASTPKSATVVIRHQTQHCHTWSFDDGKFVAAASGSIAKGATIKFINDDVMSHKLILEHGAVVTMHGNPLLGHPGASMTVTFHKAGVYVFGTKAGEDYMKGIKTIGEDNVLRLRVTVK